MRKVIYNVVIGHVEVVLCEVGNELVVLVHDSTTGSYVYEQHYSIQDPISAFRDYVRNIEQHKLM